MDKHGHTLASITYYALTNWYTKNPGFYTFTQTMPDESQEAEIRWLHTPTFYAKYEIPIASEPGNRADPQREWQVMKAIYIGLATGKMVNYACYHGKQGAFKWNPIREERARNELEQAVLSMKTQSPEMVCSDM